MGADKYDARRREVEEKAAPLFSRLYGDGGAGAGGAGGMGGMGGACLLGFGRWAG